MIPALRNYKYKQYRNLTWNDFSIVFLKNRSFIWNISGNWKRRNAFVYNLWFSPWYSWNIAYLVFKYNLQLIQSPLQRGLSSCAVLFKCITCPKDEMREKFYYTKGLIRTHKSKDRQYNGQKKKYKPRSTQFYIEN